MPQKLSQLNARIMGRATADTEAVTELYKQVQKPALFQGSTRVYTPYATDGDARENTPAPETTMVQTRAREVLAAARKHWTSLIDGVHSQDKANTVAKADIVVDGAILARDVPVTTLMFLKKRWQDVHTFLKTLPTPDPSIKWVYDTNQGLLRSDKPELVQRTKKVPKVLVKAPATDKHPAQTEVYTDDVFIGEYSKTLLSGGMPADVKSALLELSQKMIDAIKVAHEGANCSTDAPDLRLASSLFDFVFAPLAPAAN